MALAGLWSAIVLDGVVSSPRAKLDASYDSLFWGDSADDRKETFFFRRAFGPLSLHLWVLKTDRNHNHAASLV